MPNNIFNEFELGWFDSSVVQHIFFLFIDIDVVW